MSLQFFEMPKAIAIDEMTRTPRFGRFIAQPLERGFGVTIGNAFRRVLLSSLPGFAFTGLRINGVLHEFTTIPGVIEDVAEIVLNLKQVRFRARGKKLSKVTLALKGPKEFTAEDIQKASSEIEILNPELHIATLNADAEFEMELRVGYGKGYVPAEENKSPDEPIGFIPLDAIYSPIKNVRYVVESTRVGQRTDYEKLILDVETDGSITPEEGVIEAGKILREHIDLFIALTKEEETSSPQVPESESGEIRGKLLTPLEDLKLSVRAQNILKASNLKTVADLVRLTEAEVSELKKLGDRSLAEVKELVEKTLGLHFGMDVDKYLNK
ncbi:MAG: DNA-directed RNA polymerase subunit alpha [Bacteroidota bacterium]